MIIGSVRYMPPEQAGGQVRVTPAADVYGLGAVLLYAATGHPPYDGARWEAIVGQVSDANQRPDLDGLPASLVPLIEAMLAHDSTGRPSLADVTTKCTELLAALHMSPVHARHALIDRTAADTPSLSPPPPPPPEVVTDDDALDVSPEPPPDPPAEAAVAEPRPTPTGGRRPASQRVADDLRRRYATRAVL
jgi:serine/threonine protein kinase